MTTVTLTTAMGESLWKTLTYAIEAAEADASIGEAGRAINALNTARSVISLLENVDVALYRVSPPTDDE